MSQLARRERAALCDTLLAVGPDAPTLCAGWLAKDLAAHLVIREHRPLAGTGIWLPQLSARTERVQAELAAQPWDQLVAQVRSRPAWWHPARMGGAVETIFDDAEFFIHHEDVRRGDGVARPRALDTADQDALWNALTGIARLALRAVPFGIVVEVEGHQPRTIHRSGDDQVVLRGTAGELLLVVNGRGRAAEVDYDGSAEDIAALQSAALGL